MQIGDNVVVKTAFGMDFSTEIVGETVDAADRPCWVVRVPSGVFFGSHFFKKPSFKNKLYNVGNMQIWIDYEAS